ncbi:MAG: 4-hydroxythreonine-4-phosphate dehydrogenase PdxA [Acidobacteria bacterium]|nr:4-hydroxythreonine-4-phosphate dehydrogenase PdxA [Acidobacteriota bacterium]
MDPRPPSPDPWTAFRVTSTKPAIGITVGDPAGIGPEIAAAAAADRLVIDACRPVIYGDEYLPSSMEAARAGITIGAASAAAGRAAYDLIVRATEDAVAGRIDAIATAPIHKAAFAMAGLPWRGHTELLAHLTGAGPVAMMFYSDALRVILATVHIPLAEVPGALTRERLTTVIRLAATELPRFGFPQPRLALAGLNPHAGEDGLLGSEEERTLKPAVAQCRRDGIEIAGPFPADTVFVRAARGEFDAVIACYHDQGLIPAKLAAFGRAVNVTLGLPIIRTSVDHGTAFDIAGTGQADPGSMVHAVLLAARLARGNACKD